MSGVGPLGGPIHPSPLTGINKDGGGGGGGRYTPNRQQRDGEHEPDEAELSEEAKQHIEKMKAAQARPEANDARLAILSEIQTFNDLHLRHNSALKAVLKPVAGGSALHIEDRRRAVDIKPFGDTDIFHHTPQEVRTKLQTFDHSQGSVFDGRV